MKQEVTVLWRKANEATQKLPGFPVLQDRSAYRQGLERGECQHF